MRLFVPFRSIGAVTILCDTVLEMIKYLTGCTNRGVEAVAFERGVGLLVQPGNGYHSCVGRYPAWAGDNGAFTKTKGGFSADKFRRMLGRPELQAAADRCLFVVAPDKLVVLPDGVVVGDARGTLEQFPEWAREIRAAGFPVALVAQDGLEGMLDEVPWDLVDVLFVGGSTEWKLSAGARTCVLAARARGKRTHIGARQFPSPPCPRGVVGSRHRGRDVPGVRSENQPPAHARLARCHRRSGPATRFRDVRLNVRD